MTIFCMPQARVNFLSWVLMCQQLQSRCFLCGPGSVLTHCFSIWLYYTNNATEAPLLSCPVKQQVLILHLPMWSGCCVKCCWHLEIGHTNISNWFLTKVWKQFMEIREPFQQMALEQFDIISKKKKRKTERNEPWPKPQIIQKITQNGS